VKRYRAGSRLCKGRSKSQDGHTSYFIVGALAACFLMMARRLHVYEMDLKFAALKKILLIIMMSFYENVRSSKRLTVVVAFTLYFLGLATYYHES